MSNAFVNNPPSQPANAGKDLWQILDEMIQNRDKFKPQDKEFFGTIRKVLKRGNTGFQPNNAEEKMRFEVNWPKKQANWPIYALVEVPYLTVRTTPRWHNPRDWEYNFLTVDITKMKEQAKDAVNKIIVFTFDAGFNHPTFSRYPSNEKDDASFAAPPAKPKPKLKPTVSVKPPLNPGHTGTTAANKGGDKPA